MNPVRYSQLTREQRQVIREQYVRAQGGKCYYCKNFLFDEPPEPIMDKKIDWSLFPVGFFDYPIHLQHNHDTDLTEGAVHAYCNAVMWQYERK